MEFFDYRDHLKLRLEADKKRNPRLSLHAFARRLKISPAFLSMLMSKKKHMAVGSLMNACDYLELSEVERLRMLWSLLEQTCSDPHHQDFFRRRALLD